MKVLSEESAVRILRSANSPKNAFQLSQDCDISLTTVYRQIKRLNDKKLLVVSGSIDESGKKHFVFRRRQSVYCKCACSTIDLSPFLNLERLK
ncbi:MAG TPA: HTH domain-containing protein [Candidatus Nitrosotalea sp.]|nr:HTH domain-containing protein [Candidatus Nitrosotalea sp.]